MFWSLFSVTIVLLYIFVVRLIKGNETVGLGLVMPEFNTMHGYEIKNGWKALQITTLFVKNLECWFEYPTGEGIIEQGSFSAWPDDSLEYFTEHEGETNHIQSWRVWCLFVFYDYLS